jgi:glycosyltransferase involved in cell wall biosynthesis
MDQNEIAFSVVIPAYNADETLIDTLESVLAQSFPAKEIIIVDDGSTKPLPAAVTSHPKVTLIRQENGGVSSARNTGILESSAPFIAFLDSDDIWLDDKLELVAKAIQQHPEAVGYYTYFHFWEATKESALEATQAIEQKHTKTTIDCDDIYHKQLLTNHALTSATVIRREALTLTGLYDTSLPVAEDWDLIIRLTQVGLFCRIDKPLTLYRIAHSSLTSSIKDKDYASAVVESAILKYGYTNRFGHSLDRKLLDKRAYRRHIEYGAAAFKQADYVKASHAFWRAMQKQVTAKIIAYLVLSHIKKWVS